jgi:hypothetical protein
MSARYRCRSGASGVVRSYASFVPPIRTPVVPITPGTRPASRNTLSRRYVEVVFPAVPVIPTVSIASDGDP